MGWGTDGHEGVAVEVLADGVERSGRHNDDPRRDDEPVAQRAVCSCGWRSGRLHPLPPRPSDSYVSPPELTPAAWEEFFRAAEAVEDACCQGWRLEHFDPLLGFEPHTQLIEAADAGGRRHFLDGRPVHAGAVLELLLRDGRWLAGRYMTAAIDRLHHERPDVVADEQAIARVAPVAHAHVNSAATNSTASHRRSASSARSASSTTTFRRRPRRRRAQMATNTKR